MAKSLPEIVLNLFINHFPDNISLRKICFLMLIAKRKTSYIFELARDFGISEKKASCYCGYFNKYEIIKFRENHKGFIVELDKQGEILFRRINTLTNHKKIVEIITCPKCKKNRQKSTHHILPQEHFGNNHFTIDLCQICHDKIGELVHGKVKMNPEIYMRITFNFINTK